MRGFFIEAIGSHLAGEALRKSESSDEKTRLRVFLRVEGKASLIDGSGL
jgi:hypothetical protein